MLRFFLYIPFLRAHVWLTNLLYLKGVCLLPFDGRFVYIMYLRLFVCLYLCTLFFIRIFNRICICICIWRQLCTWQDEFRLYPLAADWGVRSAPGAESVLPVWLFHGYISHTMPVIIAVIICIIIISVISVIIIVTLLPSIIIVVINIQVFVFRLIVQFDCVAWSVIIISSRVRLAYMISSSWFLIALIITMIMISS